MNEDLRVARELLEDLRDENDRLLAEAMELDVLSFVGGSLVGLDDRAQSVVGLIEAVDRFVGTVFLRVEQMALQGDAQAAFRLRRATANILAALQGTSPLDDTIVDVTRTVQDATRDLDDIVQAALVVGGATLLGALVGALAGGGGYTFLGATIGGLVGAGVRALTK